MKLVGHVDEPGAYTCDLTRLSKPPGTAHYETEARALRDGSCGDMFEATQCVGEMLQAMETRSHVLNCDLCGDCGLTFSFGVDREG